MKRIKSFATAIALLVTVNCTLAQVAPVDKNNLAIGGYDVVEYFSANKASKGIAKYTATLKNVQYNFVNKKNLVAFKANPAQYLPQCDGYCAWGVAEKNAKFTINPETFKVSNGKLYLFFNGDFNGQPFNTLTEWNKDEQNMLNKITSNWDKIKDAN
jgi:YHS domain-containing protein